MISQSYEVLSDSQKRRLYDQGGEEAVKRGFAVPDGPGPSTAGASFPSTAGGGGFTHPFEFSAPDDIFNMFFFGADRFRNGPSFSSPRRGRPPKKQIFQVAATLEELYVGAKKRISVAKRVVCDVCRGKGSLGKHRERFSRN